MTINHVNRYNNMSINPFLDFLNGVERETNLVNSGNPEIEALRQEALSLLAKNNLIDTINYKGDYDEIQKEISLYGFSDTHLENEIKRLEKEYQRRLDRVKEIESKL